MKALALLLLLDYSGSMDQPLKDKPKIDQLKVEVRALLSANGDEASARALIFGSDPKKRCQDIRDVQGSSADLSKKLMSIRPGAFGKTPLTEGLMQTLRLAVKTKARNVVVVTDGADSCGKDPCQWLKKFDQEMKGSQGQLKVQIIGFDLKNEQSNLNCLKDLNLKNMALGFSEVGDSEGLQEELKKSQEQGLDGEFDADATAKLNIKGAKRSKINSQSRSDSKNDKKNSRGSQKNSNKGMARVEIQGAPSTAQFSAKRDAFGKNWFGSYVVTLPPGEYRLRFLDANGGELVLNLPADSHTQIPWARLMKVSTADLAIQSPRLSFKWHATDLTQAVHGRLEDFETSADLSAGSIKIPPIPYGSWEVEVVSPPWLKDAVKGKLIQLPLGAIEMNLSDLFKDEIFWANNPDPTQPCVLSIRKKDGVEESHFIGVGQKNIPIARGSKARFQRPKNPPK